MEAHYELKSMVLRTQLLTVHYLDRIENSMAKFVVVTEQDRTIVIEADRFQKERTGDYSFHRGGHQIASVNSHVLAVIEQDSLIDDFYDDYDTEDGSDDYDVPTEPPPEKPRLEYRMHIDHPSWGVAFEGMVYPFGSGEYAKDSAQNAIDRGPEFVRTLWGSPLEEYPLISPHDPTYPIVAYPEVLQ